MNLNLLYGAATALIMARPPDGSAGKNFTTSSPNSIAFAISLGVTTPGVIGIFFSMQYVTIFGSSPGLTMNSAPAAMARSTCSVVRTVPAPTTISGNSVFMMRIDSSAASVRKVTSAHARPPSQSALARGAAFAASSSTTTGTIPNCSSFCNVAFIFILLV